MRAVLALAALVAIACWTGQSRAAAATSSLIASNSTWRFLKGTNEASLGDFSAWRQRTFSDSAWTGGSAPFYYGETFPRGTVLSDMQNKYSTVFLRQKFILTNLADVTGLTLRAMCDDGFVAWLNGIELARYNVPAGDLAFNAFASQNVAEPVGFQSYSGNGIASLAQGTNVLTVQVFNISLASSDIVFDAELSAGWRETAPPIIAGVAPEAGMVTNLSHITVTFSEPVVGVRLEDLRLNGEPAASVTGSGAVYVFNFAPPRYGLVQVSCDLQGGIADLAVPPNLFNPAGPDATWQYYLSDPEAPRLVNIHPPPGLTLRSLSQVEIQFDKPVLGVQAADLLVNGQPTREVTGFAAGPYCFQFLMVTNGAVTIEWAAGHGISDESIPPNAFAGFAWHYALDPAVLPGDLIINEFLAENVSGLLDEDGEAQDWIEIYNRGDTAVTLEGWSLSDDPAQPRQWVFPAIVLPARQYLLVFASGKDRRPTAPGGRLHANFKLNPSGEYLGLCSPESPPRVISALAPQFPEQRIDCTYGLDPAGQWRYYTRPTPGEANDSSQVRQIAAPVHFSVQRGFFSDPFQLSLATETPNAVIRFTIDGSAPSGTNGTVYTNSILINTTRVVRAAAFATGCLPSAVKTHTYFYSLPATRQLLPALSLVTATNNLFGPNGIMEVRPRNTTKHGIAWERPVSAEWIRPEDNGGFQIDCGIRVQGGDYVRARYDPKGSLPFNKYSFRLYFRGDYGPGRLDYPVFPNCPVRSFDSISLRAGMNDASNPYVRDELVRRLSADTGLVASHGTFVNLFINGVYKGYYNPAEHISADFLQSWLGGDGNWDLLAQSGEVQEGDMVAWNALRSWVSNKDLNIRTNYLEAARRLDLADFADYLLPLIYGATSDWPWNNWRVARDRGAGGPFRFIVWDAEWSFGYNNTVSWNTLANELGGTGEIATLYKKLRATPEFRLLFADRVHQHLFNGGALTDERIRARYEELKSIMSGSIPGFNNTIGSTWIPSRRGYVLKQLAAAGLLASSNAPVFNQFGGRVPRGFSLTMTATNGVIYYTTNGVDPRVPFTGAVVSDALVYQVNRPLVLDGSLWLKARTLSGTNWSAVTATVFQVNESLATLKISEILFAPTGGDAYEFIELRNPGAAPIDLSGVSFDGIEFMFPLLTPALMPGACVVLIADADPPAFATRYPQVQVAGIYHGRLADAGEKLTVRDRHGRVLDRVRFKSGEGWPTADGLAGRSIELIDLDGDPNDAASWRASLNPGGSPGAPNQPYSLPDVRINEVMASNVAAVPHGGGYPDWIELYNAGNQDVRLEGWSLSAAANRRTYVFPGNAVLPAAGCLLLWCDGQTGEGEWHTGFPLDRKGDTLLLHDARFALVDTMTYGAQLSDFSIGRVAAAGEWQLMCPTPGGSNLVAALAATTNVVINEVMARPAPGGLGWIELYNRDLNLPVALRGLCLGATNSLGRLPELSFIGPAGFSQFFVGDESSASHLDLSLSTGGDAVFLIDQTGREIDRVSYGPQIEGASFGRLPDGTAAWVVFTNTASPAARNYSQPRSSIVINEILAHDPSGNSSSGGRMSGWIELYNPKTAAFDLTGLALSVNKAGTSPWSFPAGALVAPFGYLVVTCDGTQTASVQSEPNLNLGQFLDRTGGSVVLLNARRQTFDRVDYGLQIPGLSIGRTGSKWSLLARPTRGAPNATEAALGKPANLRLNEYLAASSAGNDWIELFNSDPLPVSLAGLCFSDDPSISGRSKFMIAPLSFIAGGGFGIWIADGQNQKGPNHLTFNLDGWGETLRLYDSKLALIDSIDFGPQEPDISSGRYPDGGSAMVRFPGWPTPGYVNHFPVPDDIDTSPVQLGFTAGSGTGSLRLNLTGPANAVYILQVSTNLLIWESVATNTAPTGCVEWPGIVSFNEESRFYRAQQMR